MIVTVSEGTVLDTETMELVENQTVVIEADRIVDVVDGRSSVEADVDIDASGQFIMPGFVDGHFHHWIVTMDFGRLSTMTAEERGIMSASLAEGTVRRGFTTIRDAGGEATVNELAEPFDVSLPAVSKHIKVLEEVGLITQGRKAQYRPCSLEPGPLQTVASWTDQYRHIWDASFDRMDAYLDGLKPDDDAAGKTDIKQDGQSDNNPATGEHHE